MAVGRLSNRARFRLARLFVPLAFAALLLAPGALRGQRSHSDYVIDRAAWGSHQSSGAGRWIVLGPRGHPTSRISFDTLWTRVRVEDHQAYRAPYAPAGHVEQCRTVFETERLRVTAEACHQGRVRITVRNDLDQPRLVLIEGRVAASLSARQGA